MALTLKNKLLIAYKKLLGKSHTNSQFDDVNESISSAVQTGTDIVFADVIPPSPGTSLYDVTDNIVEKIDFELVSIPLSEYTAIGSVSAGINDDGDGAPTLGTFTSGRHAYALKLPSDYESNSSNTKAGSGFFVNDQQISSTGGKLQIVPQKYGTSYAPVVSSSSGIINTLDEENYYLDTYSGILFLQDINRVPTKVSAYLYVGQYLDQKITINKILIDSDYTLGVTERAVFATNSVSPTVTITLPSATLAESREYYFVKSDDLAGNIVIAASGSEMVNGVSTFEMHGPHQSITLISNGTDWYVF
jgi:hypothetical protein